MVAAGSVADFTSERIADIEQATANALGIDVSRVEVRVEAASVKLTIIIGSDHVNESAELEERFRKDVGVDAAAVGEALGLTIEQIEPPEIVVTESAIDTGNGGGEDGSSLPMIVGSVMGTLVVFVAAAAFGRHALTKTKGPAMAPARKAAQPDDKIVTVVVHSEEKGDADAFFTAANGRVSKTTPSIGNAISL